MGNGAESQGLLGVKKQHDKFFQIPANLYQTDEIIGQDLYLLYQGQYLLFRPKNLIWKEEDNARLEEFGVKELYISCADESEHHTFLETNLQKILDEPKIDAEKKAEIIYSTSQSVLGDIFDRPNSSENVKRSVSLVKNSLDYLRNQQNFFDLMRMASTDFSEYTHAVQTSAYAIALARALGMKSFNELSAIGIGSILHDLGKVRIDRKILDKPGELDEHERREIEKHPEYGFEILHRQRSVPEIAEMIVLQHHERPTGRGYPYRLEGDMSFSAKIVSIADCFDSLTSDRPFKERMKPLEALKYIRSECQDEYDQNILTQFIIVLGQDRDL